jgi:predicted Rossmann fold nucleotide-binding protein DprA/Smf involved in DNA uptake
LVETAADIIAELGGALAGMRDSISKPHSSPSVAAKILTDEEHQALGILGYEPIDLDGLMHFSPWSVARLSQILVALELKNIIVNENGFYQRLV